MSPETLFAIIVFAFVSSITPGPNNFMLLASGVNFGFRRTIPHMCGIGAGFFTLLMGVGFGLGALFTTFPQLHIVLKIVGGLYLLWLAWKIATARSLSSEKGAKARPMTFMEAAAFQWVNPKAWIMAVTGMALFTRPDAPYLSVFFVAAAFALVNFPSVSTWAGFGTALRGFLADPVRLKWFNVTMGVLLAASVVPMLW
ncbi:LysE family transporter [Aliihoeflea aestuarii]|jgi:threonine/homoserine/homoserine lactone efflux protein|uniref:LysE family translocator n=1 Tax=Aliihoeflea aestuarii TaxID=453840 RepID=UPI002095FD84|nr:LysE family translocator [Aliihoeflea aestuarii]MCO6392292.1 LysE family transporter [Aliihoeflea aestuarii]